MSIIHRPLCRHCRRRLVSRPRRLCYGCSVTPAVRDLYPPQGRRGVWAGENPNPPPPPYPTRWPPGSEGKILVLAWRVASGYSPHHPLDATREGSE